MVKQTILLADNNKTYLQLMKEVLKNKGYSVISAKSLEEARLAVQKRRFSLAIFDLRLRDDADDKDTSGLLLARTIPSSIPKIILTRWPTYSAVRDALAVGADGQMVAMNFVAKQEDTPVLLKAVENAFGTVENRILISELRRGNGRAWKRLWNEEAWRLINFARRYGLSDADARTMCLDLFGDLVRGKQPPTRNPDMRAFLFGEALNKMRARRPPRKGASPRGRKKTTLRVAQGHARTTRILPKEIFHTDIVAPAVKKKVSRDKLAAKFKEGMDDLSAKERKAIVLHLFEELALPDIALKLGVKESTVDKYLKNAHTQLRSKIAELE